MQKQIKQTFVLKNANSHFFSQVLQNYDNIIKYVASMLSLMMYISGGFTAFWDLS